MASNHDTTTAPHPHHHLRRHHRRSSSSSLRRGALTLHNDGTTTAAAAANTGGGGLVTTEVWFLDNSTRSYSLPRGATAGDLVKAIVERLGLRVGGEEEEEDGGVETVDDLLPFFGLVESYTGATLDRPVNKAEPLAGLLDAHTSSSSTDSGDSSHSHSSKLVFLLSAPGFPCLRQLSMRDPALLYHRYIQAVHATITCLLPPIPSQDPSFLLRLACLQLRAKLAGGSGDAPDASTTMDTVGVSEAAFARALGNRIIEYIPAAVLGDRRAAEWCEGMAALFEADPTLRALSETKAQQAYLSMVEPLPLFGATLFSEAVADPGTAQAREVVLAVDGGGLGVYDPWGLAEGRAVSRVALEVMGQWGFYPQAGGKGLLYFTRKAGEGTEEEEVVVNYASEWAKEVCEVLTVCAYAYLKDAELVGGGKGLGDGGVDGMIPVEEEEGGSG